MTSLEKLLLTDCTRITGETLQILSSSCSKLKHLSLSGCSSLEPTALLELKQPRLLQEPISRSFLFLDLSYLSQVTKECFFELFKNLPRIEHLNLSGCTGVDDEVLDFVVANSKRITTLILSRCSRLTDRSICSIALHLWPTVLDLSFCPKLSDKGVEVIACECLGLEELNFTRCSRLTDESLLHISHNLQLLRKLTMVSTMVSTGGAEEFSHRLPSCSLISREVQEGTAWSREMASRFQVRGEEEED